MVRKPEIQDHDKDVERRLEQILEEQFAESSLDDPSLEESESKDWHHELEQSYVKDPDLEKSNTAKEKLEDQDSSDDIDLNKEIIKQLKPANDATPSISYYSILTSPKSGKFYLISFIISAIWIVASALLINNIAKSSNQTILTFVHSFAGIVSICAMILPIATIWGFLYLIKNAHDLTAMVRSLAHNQMRQNELLKDPQSTLMSSARSRVEEEVDGIDLGIQKAYERACEIEDLVHGEVANLERAYNENEVRIRKLVNTLANERQAILEHADRLKSALQITKGDISGELAEVADKITMNIETIADQLGKTLNERTQNMLDNLQAIDNSLNGSILSNIESKSDYYIDKIGEIFQNIDQSIVDKGNLSLKKFDQQLSQIDKEANTIVNNFNSKFDNLDNLLSNRTEQSLQKFDTDLEKFTERFVAIPEHLNSATKQAFEDFKKNLAALDDVLSDESKSAISSFINYSFSIEEHTDRLTALLDSRVTEINKSIDQTADKIADSFNKGQNSLLDTVDITQDKFAKQIAAIERKIADHLESKTERIGGMLEDSDAKVAQYLSNEAEKMGLSFEDRFAWVAQYLENIEEDIKQKLGTLDDFNARNIENIASYNKDLQNKLDQGLSLLNSTLSLGSERMNSSVDEKLANATFENARLLDNRIQNIQHLITNADMKVQEILREHSDTYIHHLNESSELIDLSFNKHINTLTGYAEGLHQAIAHSEKLEENLQKQTAHLDDVIQEAANNLHQAFNKSIEHNFQELENSSREITANIREDLIKSASIISQEAEKASGEVEKINSHFEKTLADFESNFDLLHSSLVEGSNFLSGTIEAKINEIEDSVNKQAESSTHKILEAGQTLNKLIMDNVSSIEQKILERSNLLTEASEKVKNEFGDQISNLNETLTAFNMQAEESINSTIQELHRASSSIYQASVGSSEAINQVARGINNTISSTSKQIEQQFAIENKALLQALAERSSQITDSLYKFNSDFYQNVSQIVNHLINSSSDIFSKTEGLIDRVQNTENKLTSAFDKFSHNTKDINEKIDNSSKELSERIEKFKFVSDDAKSDIENISNNLSKHAEVLSNIVTLLDKSRHDFSGDIQERQKAMTLLAKALDEKADEMSQAMMFYQKLIERKINDTSEKATKTFSNISQEMQSNLNNAIEKFKTASSKVQKDASNLEESLSINNNDAKTYDEIINNNARNMRDAVEQQSYALRDVANILRNTSRSAPTQSSNISLRMLAPEIIKSTNKNELHKLWKYYRRGKNNINPDDLYDDNGLQLVRTIKRQYLADPSFKKSVDEFIFKFENILKGLTQKGDNAGIFKALQNNTGAIYTMLSYVIGRIC